MSVVGLGAYCRSAEIEADDGNDNCGSGAWDRLIVVQSMEYWRGIHYTWYSYSRGESIAR